MPVTLSDEKLIAELTRALETVEIRATNGRFLGVFIPAAGRDAIRGHGAFLAGYAAEDEGLYDADAGR